jgi:hypothetical protein
MKKTSSENTSENKLEQILSDKSVSVMIFGLLNLLTTLSSRFVLTKEIGDILGSQYNRSIVEHGIANLGITTFLWGTFILIKNLLQETDEKDSKELKKIMGILLPVILFFQTVVEFENQARYARPFQWEQLLAAIAGMGLGQLLVWLMYLKKIETNLEINQIKKISKRSK